MTTNNILENEEFTLLDISNEFEEISTDLIEDTKEEPEEIKEEPEENIEIEEDPIVIFAKDLKERNLIALEKEDDITVDDLYQGFEKSIEQKANEKLDVEYGFLSDEKVRQFITYLKNGGNLEDYIEVEQEFDGTLDMENEDELIEFAHYYLENFNNIKEKEDREDFIDNLKIKGKLEEKVSSFLQNFKTLKEQQKAQLILAQEQKAKELKAKQEQDISTIKNFIKTGDISGYKIPDKNKNSFEDFLFKPLIKEVNGKKITTTSFKEKLSEYVNTPDKLTRLAYELFENFSKGTEEQIIESKVKNKLIESLRKKNGTQNTKNNLDLEIL